MYVYIIIITFQIMHSNVYTLCSRRTGFNFDCNEPMFNVRTLNCCYRNNALILPRKKDRQEYVFVLSQYYFRGIAAYNRSNYHIFIILRYGFRMSYTKEPKIDFRPKMNSISPSYLPSTYTSTTRCKIIPCDVENNALVLCLTV